MKFTENEYQSNLKRTTEKWDEYAANRSDNLGIGDRCWDVGPELYQSINIRISGNSDTDWVT